MRLEQGRWLCSRWLFTRKTKEMTKQNDLWTNVAICLRFQWVSSLVSIRKMWFNFVHDKPRYYCAQCVNSCWCRCDTTHCESAHCDSTLVSLDISLIFTVGRKLFPGTPCLRACKAVNALATQLTVWRKPTITIAGGVTLLIPYTLLKALAGA